MCWSIDKEKFEANSERYHHIAQEDIIVYKIGRKKYNKFRPYIYGDFHYKVNSLNNEISLHMNSRHDECYSIDEGYHSYSGECYLITYLKHCEKTFDIETSKGYRIMPVCLVEQPIKIGKFIIPKGSEYYVNECEEIVSSQLMWTGECYLISKMEIGKTIQLKNL